MTFRRRTRFVVLGLNLEVILEQFDHREIGRGSSVETE